MPSALPSRSCAAWRREIRCRASGELAGPFERVFTERIALRPAPGVGGANVARAADLQPANVPTQHGEAVGGGGVGCVVGAQRGRVGAGLLVLAAPGGVIETVDA